ncbi:OadG family protein [Halomonas sp. M20]|uniref:OadG family protein n=1 Tax=Halomonas sp. M20 TaxID=2763264 RepID=UPI001D0A4EB4|nr:OadG family transporter subunit [Halomonas sp. M20]
MDNTSLMQEGLSLVAFGMGFVFVFLTLLVFATALMSRLVMSFVPAPVGQEKSSRSTPEGGKGADNHDEMIAVISAAVKRYRQRHRR